VEKVVLQRILIAKLIFFRLYMNFKHLRLHEISGHTLKWNWTGNSLVSELVIVRIVQYSSYILSTIDVPIHRQLWFIHIFSHLLLASDHLFYVIFEARGRVQKFKLLNWTFICLKKKNFAFKFTINMIWLTDELPL
jgi:hypothetical protein